MNKTTLKLSIELVPSTAWYSNLRQYYKKSNNLQKWHEIKKELFAREGYKCWICGNETKRLEAHEFWKYDDIKRIQKLEAIHHLCGLCHKIKHIGLWLHSQDGESMLTSSGLTRKDIINHFCNVNQRSEEEFQKCEGEAFKIWSERSKHKWKQDFGEYDPIVSKRRQGNQTITQFTK